MLNVRPARRPRPHLSCPKRHEDEQEVQNGLALTPAQMLDMTEKRIPITPQNLGLTYEEAVDVKNFEVSPEYRRGVDIGDLWELREHTNKRFEDAIKNVKPEGAE